MCSCPVFPESVWAKGSSNSCVCHLPLSYIFTSSHLHSHTLTSSHLHILHLPLYIFTYSHLHTHTHIFISSHTHIFSFSLSHSHLHIFTSSLTSSHSHTHIFTSSHTHIFSFSLSHSHLHILTSSLSLSLLFPLSFLSPFSLARLPYLSLSLGRGWCRRGVTKRQSFRTKWGSMRKNWSKIAIVLVPEQPFRTKWGSIVKNWGVKLRFYLPRSNPFARNEVRSSKTEVKYGKIAIVLVPEQPFRTKWGSIVKNWGKIAIVLAPEQPFRTKWGSMRKNWGKIAILLAPEQPFRTKWDRSSKTSKTEVELRFYLCRTCPGATFSHEMRVDAQKLR